MIKLRESKLNLLITDKTTFTKSTYINSIGERLILFEFLNSLVYKFLCQLTADYKNLSLVVMENN